MGATLVGRVRWARCLNADQLFEIGIVFTENPGDEARELLACFAMPVG